MSMLFYCGLAVIVILGLVAIYYQSLVYRKAKQDGLAEQELARELAGRRERNKNSIVVILRAVVDEQVSITEASIRINAISQSMKFDDNTRDILSVFRQVAEATAHIPILEKWRELSKKQQLAYDVERAKIEENFRDFVIEAAKKISADQAQLDSPSV